MAQINSWYHSTFKETSNDTSHAQLRVKMKKLWLQKVKEEKQATEQKLCRYNSRLCRDKASNKARNFVSKKPDYVATKLEEKLCCKNVYDFMTKPKTR